MSKVARFMLGVFAFFGALAAQADTTITNLDYGALTDTAKSAIEGVSGPSMKVWLALLAIGIALSVVGKFLGRRR